MRARVVPWLIGLLSASSFAQAGPGAFVPGHVYVSETGTEGCFAERGWIREIDPVTGESWIFADYADGLCDNSGLRFTPDGSRLRVLNLSSNTIQDYEADGNATLRYDHTNGLGGPFGGNGLLWDGRGAFYVSNEYSSQILRFDCLSCPPRVLVESSDGPIGGGGLGLATDGSLLLSRTWLLRITPDNTVQIFHDYGAILRAVSVAFDRAGNLYVAAIDALASENQGRVFRYRGSDPSTRELLVSNLTASDRIAIDFSADESILYLSTHRSLYSISVDRGAAQVLFTTPREDDFVRRLGRGIAVYKAPKPGDMNCDNWVNNFDIDPFVLALSDEAGYQARFGWCDRTRADMNADGAINSFDIDGFVAAVVGDAGE